MAPGKRQFPRSFGVYADYFFEWHLRIFAIGRSFVHWCAEYIWVGRFCLKCVNRCQLH